MQFISQCYTFDWRPNYPFFVTATRYIPSPTAAPQLSDPSVGFTAVFAHGTGFHKEQWEPTIHHLFKLSNTDKSFLIREVWSVDCPNHGQSYILNEEIIAQSGYTLIFPWDEYTKALYWLLTQNKEYDFSTHRLIAVGHSMGADFDSIVSLSAEIRAIGVVRTHGRPTRISPGSPVIE
ncbi:hypothetical protein Clacol_008834 [Clathrus columnatus]|uniref:AB hydrolase-1 domain-containing protein n=1 Tax=Clathrus columnatus TaxID=1419009 RepID=A0AAV5AN54_9AGAM|nr:hypothetical protein Clacol_008834 [Clathrus columnatus]